jgi:hypothetical protein
MHLGTKGGNAAFLEFSFWWLEEALKKMQALGITTIIQTGDLFDVRKFMHINVMYAVLTRLKPLLTKYGITDFYVYAGNHDVFLRDENGICSLQILENLSDNDVQFWVNVDEVYHFWSDDKRIALVPWLNKNNKDRLLKEINNADYVFGHFEMVGMPMVPGGAICEQGLSIPAFSAYKRVISGHFHTISSHLNCTMVGTPYHLNWGDTLDGTNRGFWTLDTMTDEFELIKNDEFMTLFSVLVYDPEENYDEKFFAPYEGTLVKVLVKEKPDAKHYKKFSDQLTKAKLIDYKIIDNTIVEIEKVEISEEVLSLDTLSALNAYIDGQADDFEKDSVKKLAKHFYMEALNGSK